MGDRAVSKGLFHNFENCDFKWTELEAMHNCVKEEVWSNDTLLMSCCVPLDSSLSQVAGVLCIFVAVSGLIGNMMTLLAIPWATKNGLYGFNSHSCKYTNMFIVNLAFSDLVYCCINLPMYSYQVH